MNNLISGLEGRLGEWAQSAGLGPRDEAGSLRYPEPVAPRPDNRGDVKPDEQLAYLTKSQWAHYVNQFGPTEEALIGEIDSRSLVDQAETTAARQTQVGSESLLRTGSRYGLGDAPKGFTRVIQRQHEMGNAAGTAQSVNTAKLDQRERNLGLMSNLMQVGRGVAAQGISGMSDVAGMDAARRAQNAQIKAQEKAGMIGTAAGLGAMALAFI